MTPITLEFRRSCRIRPEKVSPPLLSQTKVQLASVISRTRVAGRPPSGDIPITFSQPSSEIRWIVFGPFAGKRFATSTENSPFATISIGTLLAVSTWRMCASNGNSSRRGQTRRKSFRSRSSRRTGVLASSLRVNFGTTHDWPTSMRVQ